MVWATDPRGGPYTQRHLPCVGVFAVQTLPGRSEHGSPTPMQRLHCAEVVVEACAAARGDFSDVITGNSIVSPPTAASFRTSSRREVEMPSPGACVPSASSLALRSRSRANATILSSLGSPHFSSSSLATWAVVVRPSQCCQTKRGVIQTVRLMALEIVDERLVG